MTQKPNDFSSKVAAKIGEIATDVAKNSVGKSFPWGIYEVKVPEELKKKV